MAARIVGGIAGWMSALLPLAVVNIVEYAGLLDTRGSLVAGAVALIGGIVLGGLVAGLIGGRPRGGRGGGSAAAGVSGLIAGVLYSASLIAVTIATERSASTPILIATHPIRVSVAIVFLAAVLLAVALGTGALVGRGAAQRTASYVGVSSGGRPAASASRPMERTATGSGPRSAARQESRGWDDTPAYGESRARTPGGSGPRSAAYPYHAYGPQSGPAYGSRERDLGDKGTMR